MCTSDCRTFLWGGAGQPAYGAEGLCSCICEDESWSDRNILGRASCVPVKAHKTFGWVGLGISVGVLCHAAYHLHRQINFHEQHMSASSSPVERCRRHLHIQTIMAAVISICYFGMVLGDALRWCAAVGALAWVPAFIGGSVSATRMWVYTNDPRRLRESPRLSAMSGWLERPLGNNMARCVTAIVPIVATVLALADFTELAAHLVALGGLVIAVVTMVVFMIFGRALLQAIDKSLQDEKQQQALRPSTAGGVEGAKGRRGSQTLLKAKRKVKIVVVVGTVLVLLASSITLFAVLTGFDTEVPLVMFGVIYAYFPIIWLALTIQVHGGRSGSHGRLHSPRPSGVLFPGSPQPLNMRSKLFSSTKQKQQIVPTEVLC